MYEEGTHQLTYAFSIEPDIDVDNTVSVTYDGSRWRASEDGYPATEHDTAKGLLFTLAAHHAGYHAELSPATNGPNAPAATAARESMVVYTFRADVFYRHQEPVAIEYVDNAYRLTTDNGVQVKHADRTAAFLAMAARQAGFDARLTRVSTDRDGGGSGAGIFIAVLVVLFIFAAVSQGGDGAESQGEGGKPSESPSMVQTATRSDDENGGS